MDPPPTITQRFIEHTVMWALALPVHIRHDLIASARDQARLNRQAQPGERHGDYFGDPAVWDEIAHRIAEEGHTPAD